MHSRSRLSQKVKQVMNSDNPVGGWGARKPHSRILGTENGVYTILIAFFGGRQAVCLSRNACCCWLTVALRSARQDGTATFSAAKMKKNIGPLLARALINEIETQHDAVGRLVKILAEARDADDPTAAAEVADARTALFDLLASPRLAVVSKACHGEYGIACCECCPIFCVVVLKLLPIPECKAFVALD